MNEKLNENDLAKCPKCEGSHFMIASQKITVKESTFINAYCVQCKTFLEFTDLSSKQTLSNDFHPDQIPFGKHKGKFWRDIPQNYKDWLKTLEEKDPNKLIFAWIARAKQEPGDLSVVK